MSYTALSAVYDQLIGVDYSARAEYLLSLFQKHGGKSDVLLDLACGSGSLTLELARRGCDMIGVDQSEEMLALALEKTPADPPSPLWLCQDMRQLDLYGTVSGGVCTLDGLNHLCRTADLKEVFHRLSLFIEPKGLFIFDVNTPYKHREVLGNSSFVFDEEDFFCAWRNRFSKDTCEVSMLLDIFLKDGKHSYQRIRDEVRERAYSLRTWESLLKDASFEMLAVYADMTDRAPAPDEERWVIVAKNMTTNYG